MPSTSPAAPPRHPLGRLLHQAREALDVLYREMIKFGVVGALAFVVDLGLANLLWHTVLDNRVTSAKIISGVVATTVAWLGNRQWTFRHRRNRPAHHEVSLFFGVNAVALGISAVVLAGSHYGLGFTSTLANNVATVVGIGLGTLFRFWAYRRYVFSGEPL
ncbi:MAG: GtrA family protein [Dermatophilaceae bacterium]